MDSKAGYTHSRLLLPALLSSSVSLSVLVINREKNFDSSNYFPVSRVIACDLSVNIVYLLVYAVKLRLQKKILQLRLIFLKTQKVFRINTIGFNSEHLGL